MPQSTASNHMATVATLQAELSAPRSGGVALTTRQRRERTIKSFGSGDNRVSFARDRMLSKLGLAAFTDEAIQMLGADLIKGLVWCRANNKRNREIYAREVERHRLAALIQSASLAKIAVFSAALAPAEELVG